MSKRNLLVGYDLGNEMTQIAVYNTTTVEPELIAASEKNPDGMFRTEIHLEQPEEVITGFVDKIRNGEEIMAGGKPANPVSIMSYYFRKTLTLIKGFYPTEAIARLVITVEDNTMEFATLLYEALEKLGIGIDRAMIISHKQSYLYYALCQKKELWLNDVGMFDYSDKGLFYYQMNIDRRRTPILVGVNERDLTSGMDTDVDKANAFENIVEGVIHRQVISTLYMTGTGFDGEWSHEVLQHLCKGRRVFIGKNLYVNGACYAARELSGQGRLEDFVFLDEDMIRAQITTKVYTDAKMQELILAKAGTPWYQEIREFDLIPSGEDELRIQVNNILKREDREIIIPLEGTRGRPDRMARIGVRICFQDVNTCIITLKDKGFGEFAPASNRIWEKTITV